MIRDISFSRLNKKDYTFRIGEDVLDTLAEDIRAIKADVEKVLIFTNAVDEPRMAFKVYEKLESAGITSVTHAIRYGDEAKNFDEAGRALARIHEKEALDCDFVLIVGNESVLELGAFVSDLLYNKAAYAYVVTTPQAALKVPFLSGKINVGKYKSLIGFEPKPSFALYDQIAERSLGVKTLRDVFPVFLQRAIGQSLYQFNNLYLHAEEIAKRDQLHYVTALSDALYALSKLYKEVDGVEELKDYPEYSFGSWVSSALEKAIGRGKFYEGELLAEGMRFEARLASELAGFDTAYVDMLDSYLEKVGVKPLEVDIDEEKFFITLLGKEPEFLQLSQEEQEAEGIPDEVLVKLPKKPGEFTQMSVDQSVLVMHIEAFCNTRRELVPAHKRRGA
ncbi:MAG: hypothetical protein Q4E22_06865 [Coriobacteriia bacterium]|nr:hypothetical protein [Coriobacteriia bacterium]